LLAGRDADYDSLLSTPTTSEYIRGSFYGLAAVSIWASWIVAVRLGIRTRLAPQDIVTIRFAVAGLILLPYLLKKGLAVDRLGWTGLAAIMVGGGAPMVLVAYGGLVFAPSAHAASLYTALIPLYVAILAAAVLGEKFTAAKRTGLVLIVAGVLGIVWAAGGTIGTRQNIGHAMFITAGMLWACYVVALRKVLPCCFFSIIGGRRRGIKEDVIINASRRNFGCESGNNPRSTNLSFGNLH